MFCAKSERHQQLSSKCGFKRREFNLLKSNYFKFNLSDLCLIKARFRIIANRLDFFYLFLIFNTLFTCSLGAGIFELEIIKYENLNLTITSLHEQQRLVNQNQDLFSKLFNRPLIRPNPALYSTNLVYNLCLKEAKAKLLRAPCTFGEITSSSTLMNIPVTMRKTFTFRWMKSVTMILTISKFDEATSELKSIDKHVHFDEQVIPINSSMLSNAYSWTYKTSQNAFSRLVYRFRVQCAKNYFGEDCSSFCRPRNDTFGHYKCSEDGEQNCLEGWQGEQCNKTICSPNCSSKNGYCEKPGECRCKPGYEGETCEQCIVYPGCLNGYCQQPWQCICLPGWGGIFCDQDLNFCARHQPCTNGGVCTNIAPNKYQCQCKPGFTGVNCENIINPCSIDPCLNGGICKQLNKSLFYCECLPAWTGEKCELNLNECSINSPCGKNGVCIDLIDGFECQCNEGYTGKHCNININECDNLEDACVSSNTIQCKDTIGSFNCECLPGFGGKHCELNLDDCENNPCQNQAQCIDLVNDYKCDCTKGFKDKNCSQIDESVCEHVENLGVLEENSQILSETKNYLNQNLNQLSSKENEQFWQIITTNNHKTPSCKTKWCTCNTENKLPRLVCICILEDEYNILNQKQLEKLDLVRTAQKISLTDLKADDDQENLFDQISQELQNLSESRRNFKLLNNKTNNSNLSKTEAAAQMIEEPNNSNIKIYQILIDPDQDLDTDELFVSLTITLTQNAKADQVQTMCSSMLAIYSLLCNQPHLDKLSFACKLKQNNSIRFYTLDNDERVLSIADILQKTFYSNLISSITKRTYKLSNTNQEQLNGKKLHLFTVSFIFVLVFIFILGVMICILFSNDQISSNLTKIKFLSKLMKLNSKNELQNSIQASQVHDYYNLNVKKVVNLLNNGQHLNQVQTINRTKNLNKKLIKLDGKFDGKFNGKFDGKFEQNKLEDRFNKTIPDHKNKIDVFINTLEKNRCNEKLELNNFKLSNLNKLNLEEYTKTIQNNQSSIIINLNSYSNEDNLIYKDIKFKPLKFAQL